MPRFGGARAIRQSGKPSAGPTPDSGYILLTDQDGAYLTDADGAYLEELA